MPPAHGKAGLSLSGVTRKHFYGRMHTLVIDGGVPRLGADGGSVATMDLLLGLERIGHDVFFYPDGHTGETESRSLEPLGGIRIAGMPFGGPAGLAPWITANRDRLDFVVVSRPGPAARYLPLITGLPRARRIYFGHDIHYRRLRLGAAAGIPYAPLQIRGLEVLERRLWRQFDLVVYPSAEECREVEACEPAAAAAAMPIFAFDVAAQDPAAPSAGREGALFVGGSRHEPNRDGIAWFAAEILPRVREIAPDFALRVAGHWPEAMQAPIRRPGIVFLGRISEAALREEYSRARLSVAPLRFGGGVKHKVVSAMASGLPVVSTAIGLEGLRPTPGGGDIAVEADSPADFAGAILDLQMNDALWRRLAEAGRVFCRAGYSKAAYDAALRHALATASNHRRAERRIG